MNRISLFSVIGLTAICSLLASCGGGNNGGGGNIIVANPDTAKVLQFKASDTAWFAQDSIYAVAGGETFTAPYDTVHQTVAAFNTAVSPYSGVTIFRNNYSNLMASDSDIFYQDAGDDVYEVDFGLDAVNNVKAFALFLGGAIHVGWVKAAEPAAATGTSWVAINQTVPTSGQIKTITILDTATMMADSTTYTLGGKTYILKHAQHQMHLSAQFNGTPVTAFTTLDLFLAPALGCKVIYRINPITSNVGGVLPGVQTALFKHN